MNNIKKHLLSVLLAFLIASIVYLGGALFNTTFDLSKFSVGSRATISILCPLLFIVFYLIVLCNFEDFIE